MKRSNRLVLLIGIFLAIVAFVGIVLIFQGNNAGQNATTPPTQLATIYAKVDIPFGTVVRADMVESQVKPVDQRAADAFGDVGLVVGRTTTSNIVAGKQLQEADFALSRAGQAPVTPNIATGLRAVAIQVDQVTGAGTLINVGDRVDVIAAFDKNSFIMPLASPVPNPPVPAPAGANATTVKILVEGVQVVGTLLPPPPATTTQGQQPAASQAPTTSLTGQQEIVIVAVTPQQAEIIRYAQLDGTIMLALRSPKDFLDANGKPVVPPVDKTSGVILKTLIEQYGVLPPELQPITVKGQR